MSLISVIIPTYNRAQFITRAINSVLGQSYRKIEVIVVDDGSQDDTQDRVFAIQRNDQRVHFLSHGINRGSQAARNTGILAARGEYFGFLDSDNEWLPGKLEKQLQLFRQGCDRLGVVYAGFRHVRYDGSTIYEQIPQCRGNIYRTALRHWVADTSTLLVKKNILLKAGLWDVRIRAQHEWDLCIRLARYADFDFVPDPLANYYHHSSPTISQNFLQKANGYLDVVNSHRDEMLRIGGRLTLSMNYLEAGSWFKRGGSLARGRACFKKAIRTHPFNADAWKTLIGSYISYDKWLRGVGYKRKLQIWLLKKRLEVLQGINI